MSASSLEITVRGEPFELLSEGALLYPAKKILAVADFHLGKSETFGRYGLALPPQAQKNDLKKLSDLLKQHDIERLLFLGDLVHSKLGLTPELQTEFIEELAPFKGDIHLLAGNHDRGLVKQWPKAWERISVLPEWKEGAFLFRHEPQAAAEFVWAGHVHPCVKLKSGPDYLRLRTFVIDENLGLLPAFSSLAGGFDLPKTPEKKFYALGENQVFEIRG